MLGCATVCNRMLPREKNDVRGMIKCDVRNCRLIFIGHSVETEAFIRACRVLAASRPDDSGLQIICDGEHSGRLGQSSACVCGKSGFLFCQMHAIFEQFTTAKLCVLEHYKRGAREGTTNAARVFRSALRVDAERSKK